MEICVVDEVLEEIDEAGLELEEDDVDLELADEESLTGESLEFKELVVGVLQELHDDAALSPLHEHIKKCQHQVPLLCDKLSFLRTCKPKQGSKNTPAVQEKAWGRFHGNLVTHLPDITATTGNTGVSSFLCLKLFERMLRPVPVAETPPTPSTIYSQEELDIISYIAGSIVSKVKKFSRRLQTNDQTEYAKVISYLVVENSEQAENTGLIDRYDRGGLTRVKPQISHMFVAMEDTFGSMFADTTVFSVKSFITKCCDHDDVLCGYYETIYECEAQDQVKEHILTRMIVLFFTIRVHQKCRAFMDQVRYKTRASKKQKPLREQIKS